MHVVAQSSRQGRMVTHPHDDKCHKVADDCMNPEQMTPWCYISQSHLHCGAIQAVIVRTTVVLSAHEHIFLTS